MLFDILIILFLILLNSVFAMTELAVVSSRRARLVSLAEAGNRRARLVLALKENPSRFLSTVQIGITLIGIFSGTYSGVTLAEPLGAYLTAQFPALGTTADDVAIALVVTVVTYLSLVVGELVPKQIALHYADTVAMAIAGPISALSLLTRPLVHVLDLSNRFVLALLRVKPESASAISAEEVKAVLAESAESGGLEPEERQMMERVMRLDDLSLAAAMTHRKDIVWLEADEPLESVLRKIRETRHSRFVVCEKDIEHMLGIITLKDLTLQIGEGSAPDLRAIVRAPLYMPESTSVLEALEQFKKSTAALTIVVDEHGGLQGIVTLKDIMEAIVGTLPEPAHREDYGAIQRDDGSWLVDGGYPVHEAESTLGIKGMAGDAYATLAGFMLQEIRHIPRAGEKLDWQGWRFEVMDMDGRRIDKVLVSKLPAA